MFCITGSFIPFKCNFDANYIVAEQRVFIKKETVVFQNKTQLFLFKSIIQIF